MGLEQALGFPTVEYTVMHGPETPSLKGLLTQLLAVLAADRFRCQAFGDRSAAEIVLLQGHVPFFPLAVDMQQMINAGVWRPSSP